MQGRLSSAAVLVGFVALTLTAAGCVAAGEADDGRSGTAGEPASVDTSTPDGPEPDADPEDGPEADRCGRFVVEVFARTERYAERYEQTQQEILDLNDQIYAAADAGDRTTVDRLIARHPMLMLRLAGVWEDIVAAVEDLSPPAEAAGAFDGYLAAAEKAAVQIGRVARAPDTLSDGDLTALQDALVDVERASDRLAHSCGP